MASQEFWNAILGPPTHPRDYPRNPMGVGFDGSDPNFQVPRIGPDGQIRLVTPGAMSVTGPPLDAITPQIRREDFPEGAEGDRQYREAVDAFMRGEFPQGAAPTNFDAQGNPVFDQNPYSFTPPGGEFGGSGRTVPEQAIHNFYQAGLNADQHHGGLNVISRARVRPEEAFLALTSPGITPGGPPGFYDNQGRPIMLDDATLREMLTGVGGPEAVQNYLNLVGSGADDAGSGGVPSGVPAGAVPGTEYGYAEGTWVDPNNPGLIWREDIPGVWMPFHAATGKIPSPGPSGASEEADTDDRGIEIDAQPPAPQQPPPAAPHNLAEGPPPVIDGGWQFSEVGPDVFLDVTDPRDGSTHRFTGDVVQTVYELMGYNSWEEMVMGEGYEGAIAALFGFVTPLKPPIQSPQPPMQPSGQPPAVPSPGPGVPGSRPPGFQEQEGRPGGPRQPGFPANVPPPLMPPPISTVPGGGPQ